MAGQSQILCPDCGGVIGVTEVTDGIGWPCTCGTPGADPNDTAVDQPAITGPAKPCISCGKDTNGHRRFKDSRGYMCYACAKREQRKARAGQFKCEGCGRWMPEASKHDSFGKALCPTCVAEAGKPPEKRSRKVDTAAHRAHEKRNLHILLAIMGVLLLIVILRQAGIL